jgi:DNA-binding transcriptional ArsR family regulator
MNFEDALSSKTRIKILKVLLKLGQLNTTQITKQVGSNYAIVRKHLEILQQESILEMTPYGSRIRFYRFNSQSRKADALQALLQIWTK